MPTFTVTLTEHPSALLAHIAARGQVTAREAIAACDGVRYHDFVLLRDLGLVEAHIGPGGPAPAWWRLTAEGLRLAGATT